MSKVLTGLSLATGIAREATDGVPVVKQIIGVASRIVGLAEQIDKNRDDLRGLADRARKLDATLSAIVSDRELDPEILRRLQGLNGVLNDIEKRFAEHIKPGRVRKTLRYIFTVRKDIDRLKGEFDDRLKELEMAASLDTNIIARGDSRFIGEFRNIRHCEITLLRPIARPSGINGGRAVSCHLATCEGSNKVFVVRNVLSSDLDEYEPRRNEDHIRIVEHMSLIQNRHPAITCLYGKNFGPRYNRFVVLEAGEIRPLDDVLAAGTADIAVLGQLVAQLTDASCHLHKHGAAWTAGSDALVYVDDNYKPTIGFHNDLVTMDDTVDPELCAGEVSFAIVSILDKSTTSWHAQENQSPYSTMRSAMWFIQVFGEITDGGCGDLRRENRIRRADISNLIPLSQESWTYLHHGRRNGGSLIPIWGYVLLHLAAGKRNCDGTIIGARYGASPSGERDEVTVYCVEGDVDVVYYRETHIKIPDSAADKVRQKLGIPSAAEVFAAKCWLQHVPEAGATPTECTGWIDCTLSWEPW